MRWIKLLLRPHHPTSLNYNNLNEFLGPEYEILLCMSIPWGKFPYQDLNKGFIKLREVWELLTVE